MKGRLTGTGEGSATSSPSCRRRFKGGPGNTRPTRELLLLL